jgi:hypothetical protein
MDQRLWFGALGGILATLAQVEGNHTKLLSFRPPEWLKATDSKFVGNRVDW